MHRNGREDVVVAATRTAIGREHREKGVFRDVHPADLLSAVPATAAMLRRSDIAIPEPPSPTTDGRTP